MNDATGKIEELRTELDNKSLALAAADARAASAEVFYFSIFSPFVSTYKLGTHISVVCIQYLHVHVYDIYINDISM